MSDLKKCKEILSDLVAYDVLGGESNLAIVDYIIEYLNEKEIPYRLVPNETLDKSSIHCRIGPAVDGHFADLKNKLRNHNGLSLSRKIKFIDEF
jgi:hypothetical protein